MRKINLCVLLLSMGACSSTSSPGGDHAPDCREAARACADGFQCRQIEPSGEWKCERAGGHDAGRLDSGLAPDVDAGNDRSDAGQDGSVEAHDGGSIVDAAILDAPATDAGWDASDDASIDDAGIAAADGGAGDAGGSPSDAGRVWTEILNWNREARGETLADLEAAFDLVDSNMEVTGNRPGYVLWCDEGSAVNDGNGDVADYVLDVTGMGAREVRWRLHYEGNHMLGSAMWIVAEGSSLGSAAVCVDCTVGWDRTLLYGAPDVGRIPPLTGCSCASPTGVIDTSGVRALAEDIVRIRLGFAHHNSDCTDHSRLYWLRIWVR